MNDELIRDFLEGKFYAFIQELVKNLTERGLLREYIGRLILKDCEALKWFYDRCLHRNWELKQKLNLGERLIPQNKLDDYLIWAAFKL